MPLDDDDDYELTTEFIVGPIPTKHLDSSNIVSKSRARSKPKWGRASLLHVCNPGQGSSIKLYLDLYGTMSLL